MLSVSSLLDFLMGLLRDEDAKAEFEKDPEGVLARNGFDGLCGQDVRDAGSLLVDSGHAGVKSGFHSAHGHAGSAAHEVSYIAKTYVVQPEPVIVNSYNDYIIDYTYVDDRDIIGDNNNVIWGDVVANNGSNVIVGNNNDAIAVQDNSVDVDVDVTHDESTNIDADGSTIVTGDNSGDIVNEGNDEAPPVFAAEEEIVSTAEAPADEPEQELMMADATEDTGGEIVE